MPPTNDSPYNQRLAQVLRKDSGYLTRAAWKPRELTEQFGWLCTGPWSYSLRIPAIGDAPERSVSGSLEYRFSKSGNAIQLLMPGEEPMPYIIWDGFNSQFVLSMLEPRSFGHMTSKGWRGSRIIFEGRMSFAGLAIDLRQTWLRDGSSGFQIVNEERLANGSFAPIDQYVFVKAASAAV